MKPTIQSRLENLDLRLEEISALLSDPSVIGAQDRFRALSREYSEIQPLVNRYREHRETARELAAARAMLDESDPGMRDMVEDEVKRLSAHLADLEQELQKLLLPKDPNDTRNIFLEIRAGAGGDEAAIFAGDLFRMYGAYAVKRGWNVEIISASHGEHGGYKEVIARIAGNGVYSRLVESGGHRVACRLPRRGSHPHLGLHVAILPEAEEDDAIVLNPADPRRHLPRQRRRRSAREQD
jgi:peptide chain release factor 1